MTSVTSNRQRYGSRDASLRTPLTNQHCCLSGGEFIRLGSADRLKFQLRAAVTLKPQILDRRSQQTSTT